MMLNSNVSAAAMASSSCQSYKKVSLTVHGQCYIRYFCARVEGGRVKQTSQSSKRWNLLTLIESTIDW